jgi:hypothetical protein
LYKLVNHLKHCILFKDLTSQELESLIISIKYSISDYFKNCTDGHTSIVALEGDVCESLGIVLQGELEVQKH